MTFYHASQSKLIQILQDQIQLWNGGGKKLKAFLTVKSMHDINGQWGRYKELINGVLLFFRAKYRCMHKLRVNNNSFND